MDYIEIYKEDIPYRFSIQLDDKTYEMEVEYNSYGDFFTISLFNDDNLIRIEKLVYGKTLFSEIFYDPLRPKIGLIPYSMTQTGIDRITYDNFGEYILLYALDLGEVAQELEVIENE